MKIDSLFVTVHPGSFRSAEFAIIFGSVEFDFPILAVGRDAIAKLRELFPKFVKRLKSSCPALLRHIAWIPLLLRRFLCSLGSRLGTDRN